MNTPRLDLKGEKTAIDHSKKSEALSGKTERLLHMVLANVDDLIAVVDLDGRRLYNSPSYARILGEREHLRGTDSFNEIHPDDRELVKSVFQETVQTGVGRRIVYRFAPPGRSIRYIESQGNVIRNDQGRVVKVVIVSRDITDRKRIEEERTRLDMAVEQAAESIVITSSDGSIEYVNPAFERCTGYTRDEVIGKNPRLLKSGVHTEEFYRTLWATLLRGEVWSGELTNRKKNGTLYREETMISPVRDGSGTIINFVAVKRDVTYDRQVEVQMQNAQRLASLGQLAGGIAHDLNNTMNVLSGVLGLVEGKVTDKSLMNYLSVARHSVEKGTAAIKRLSIFASAHEPQLSPLAIDDLVASLYASLARSLDETITVEAKVDSGLSLIQGDQALLYQSLLTLCLNSRDAILASPRGTQRGTIRITAEAMEGRFVRNRFKEASAANYLRIRVADDGAGMNAEVCSHIFEPFFTTKQRGGGSGLGLAVVYGVVRSHHGFIDFDTVPGTGTTFSLYFPMEDAGIRESKSANESAPCGGSETILLVEDDETLRFVLEETLKDQGYKVIVAADGAEGFARFTEQFDQISAVLTDMGLPKESGFDMFLRIRELDPSARVILMSGYIDPALWSKLGVAGASGFLAKPFRPLELVATLREILDRAA